MLYGILDLILGVIPLAYNDTCYSFSKEMISYNLNYVLNKISHLCNHKIYLTNFVVDIFLYMSAKTFSLN